MDEATDVVLPPLHNPAQKDPVRLSPVKVLVIGSGAREHALCRSLSLDPDVTALHCAPGNAIKHEAPSTSPEEPAGSADDSSGSGRPGR